MWWTEHPHRADKEASLGNGSTRQSQPGKTQLGNAQLGKARLGKARLGKAQLGKAQLGKAQLGRLLSHRGAVLPGSLANTLEHVG